MDFLYKFILPLAVSLIGVLISIIKIRATRKDLALEKEEREKVVRENTNLKVEIEDMSEAIVMDLTMLNSIKDAVLRIFQNSRTDRFLILSATNGKTDMRFATAVYEQHKNNDSILLSIGATNKFKRFEFDVNYKNMLKSVENQGVVSYDTKSMPDGDLKYIYENEKVNHSLVYFLDRAKINDSKDRLFYCSVSTHSNEPYSDACISIIKSSVDIIKGELQSKGNN